MLKYRRLTIFSTIILLLISCSPLWCMVSVSPHGFGYDILAESDGSEELILINDGEIDVAYSLLIRNIDEEGEGIGPRRDDAGDIVAEYDMPFPRTLGMAWDGEWMWGFTWTAPWRLIAFDPVNEEIEVNERLNDRIITMTFLDGIIWASVWGSDSIQTYDRDGELLNEYEVGFNQVAGITSDGEDHLLINRLQDASIHVFEIQEDGIEDVNSFEFRGAMGDAQVWSIEWVPEHLEGQLWGNVSGHLYQANVIGNLAEDEIEVEAVSDFQWNSDLAYVGLAHDGENMWHGMLNDSTWYVHDDGVAEFTLVTVNPSSGIIVSDSTAEIEVLILSNDYEAGVYEVEFTINLDDPDQAQIILTALITVAGGAGNVRGTVLNTQTDEPEENILVQVDDYEMYRYSDEDGRFRFNDLPEGDYTLSLTSDEFLPSIVEITIQDGRTTLIDIEVGHAEFVPNRDDVIFGLEPDQQEDVPLSAENDGTGIVSFDAYRRATGNDDLDPWEHLFTINAEDTLEDAYLYGLVYIDGKYYISGGNNGDDINKIYILDDEGNYLDEFDQFNESNFGIQDLAWDGEFLYGADRDTVYVFTPEGELDKSFEVPSNPTHCIVWDATREYLWVANQNGTFYALNRDGEEQESINHPIPGRIYGIGYNSDVDDGYNLILATRSEDNQLQVSKLNPDSEDVEAITELDIDGDTPGGLHITSEYNQARWTAMALIQGREDWIGNWHIENRLDWMRLSPLEGEIEPGDDLDFDLSLTSIGFPRGIFSGELVFEHNGVGSPTIIPVELQIADGRRQSSIAITLHQGWNMVSVNLTPDDPDIKDIMRRLTDDGVIEMMKDGFGNYYRPAYGYNNIPDWELEQGYLIKASEQSDLIIDGVTALNDDPIQLFDGWQIVAYLPEVSVHAVPGFANIVEHLQFAKDPFGKFYIPEWDFSNMPPLKPGYGYRLRIDAEIELVYNLDEGAMLSQANTSLQIEPSLKYLPVLPSTGIDMSMLLLSEQLSGEEVAVYCNQKLVGTGVFVNGQCGVAIHGDDVTTREIDGALEGESLTFKTFDGKGYIAPEYEILDGKMSFTADEYVVARIGDVKPVPETLELHSIYPNPFNSITELVYSLPQDLNVKISVFDLSGRIVKRYDEGVKSAGEHRFLFKAESIPSGLYIIELSSGIYTVRSKVALIR